MRGDYVFERVSNTISTPSCTTHHTPHCTLHTANRTPYTVSVQKVSTESFVASSSSLRRKGYLRLVKELEYACREVCLVLPYVIEQVLGAGTGRRRREGGEEKRERGRVNITLPHSTADSQHRTHSTTERQGVIPTALPSHHKTFVAVADATQTTTITKSHIS